jgi:glycosyltransferase involved in cell wall biosynthesis
LNYETDKSVISLFLLVADLAPCGEASAVRLLAPLLPADRFRVTLGVLGTAAGQPYDDLRAAGIPIHSLPIKNMLDFTGKRRLRSVVQEAGSTVLHAWGPAAAGAAGSIIWTSAEGNNTPRFLVSGATTIPGGVGGWLIARQVRRADRVILACRVDGERYRQYGVHTENLTLINPAPARVTQPTQSDALYKSLGIPSSSQLIVGGGRTECGIGPKDAIVAFDMLRYDNPHLRLIIFGSESEATDLEQFGRALAFDDFRIHFGKSIFDRESAVQTARAVLITHAQGGVEEALEAMAAGKPVVGWQTPELMEIVEEGVTGYLVPIGDRAALATRMRRVLDEPNIAAQMGVAGRARVSARFNVSRMIDQYSRLYTELAGSGL